VALAASFALLALIPLDQFREIAVAMAVGIIIDAIVVRSLLVPALVASSGRAGRWPGGGRAAFRPRRARPRAAEVHRPNACLTKPGMSEVTRLDPASRPAVVAQR
jgi:RND superfamily putative drug exporter